MSAVQPKLIDQPQTIDELRAYIAQQFLRIAQEVTAMSQAVLDSLVAIDTRTNVALDAIEASIENGLSETEVGTLENAMTATAEKAETIAGGTPPPPTARRLRTR